MHINIHRFPLMLRKTCRAAIETYRDESAAYRDESAGLRIAKQQTDQKLADSLATHHRAQNQTHLLGGSASDLRQALENANREVDQLKGQIQLTMSFLQTFVNDSFHSLAQIEEGLERINSDAARFH